MSKDVAALVDDLASVREQVEEAKSKNKDDGQGLHVVSDEAISDEAVDKTLHADAHVPENNITSETKGANNRSTRKPKARVIQWKRATENLGARVPPEALDMLDEVHEKQLRDWRAGGREGQKPTKQSQALEMVEDYLRKQKRIK